MRTKLAVALLGICALLGAITAPAALAAPGVLDRSFGERGIVTLTPPVPPASSGRLVASAMAVGPSDEVFVLESGWTCAKTACWRETLLQRFDPNGELDTSFGSGGTAHDIPAGVAISALAVTPDGRPVVAGPLGEGVSLSRFTRSGSLDPTFGSQGTVLGSYGGTPSNLRIAVARNGGVVLAANIAGSSYGGDTLALARFLPNGEPDPSFGIGTGEMGGRGWLTIPSDLHLGGLGVSNSGQIALGATGCCPRRNLAYESRRLPKGKLIGHLRQAMPWTRFKVGGGARVSSVIALPNGKVYLVGVAGRAAFAAKLLRNGKLERRYGRHGVVRIRAMNAERVAPVALVDEAGRLVIAGKKEIPGDEEGAGDLLVVRRQPRGGRDRSFGNGSVVDFTSLGLGNVLSTPVSIGLQSTGRIVVAGERSEACIRTCPPPRSALVRLLGGSAKRKHHR